MSENAHTAMVGYTYSKPQIDRLVATYAANNRRISATADVIIYDELFGITTPEALVFWLRIIECISEIGTGAHVRRTRLHNVVEDWIVKALRQLEPCVTN
jgi:hypothetical protein